LEVAHILEYKKTAPLPKL